MAQNIAEFRIIGRIGAINTSDKVTNVEVAANYHRKDGDDWKTDTLWNRVTTFAKPLGLAISSTSQAAFARTATRKTVKRFIPSSSSPTAFQF
jgi:hypothetical protein